MKTRAFLFRKGVMALTHNNFLYMLSISLLFSVIRGLGI